MQSLDKILNCLRNYFTKKLNKKLEMRGRPLYAGSLGTEVLPLILLRNCVFTVSFKTIFPFYKES